MKRVSLAVGTLLLASTCATQDEAGGKSLVQGAKLAKVNLVDAVQKANKALTGQVVGAMLEIGKEKGKAAYAVLVLHEGNLWSVDVDAQTGAVGNPKVAEDDDDHDERGEKGVEEKHERKPAGGAGNGPIVQSVKLDFDDTAVGTLPQGWRAAETAGAGKLAAWRVEERPDGASGERVLSLVATQNSGSTFNLVLSDASFPADLALSVKVHANSGSEDQGGGLVWRSRDASNYYLARWNPLEDNLRCYKVVGDKRTMFKSADVKADPKAWHQLAVSMQGNKCTIAFDGKELLEFADDTFANAGRIGVWTKADAASSFDDLEARGK